MSDRRTRRIAANRRLWLCLILALVLLLVLAFSLAAALQLLKSRTEAYTSLPVDQTIRSIDAREGTRIAIDSGESALLDGIITYTLDERAVNLIIELNNVRDNLRISLVNEDGSGVILGEGNALMKHGELQDEVTFTPINDGVVFWSQIPRRIVEDHNQFTIMIEDAQSSASLAEALVVLHND